MTARFDIESLIPAVVQEEENRHQIENDDPDDVEEPERQYDVVAIAALSPHERRNLRLERMAKDHRRKQRNQRLASITPRLEILQNLPFFIPFATRVQIFREFVAVDQGRRRGGFVDPDQWRAAVLSRSSHLPVPSQGTLGDSRDNLNRHHATIRRNKTFEDAYEQFWPLGEGLKEPIQITFVDKFGAEEAGIDGGGVTKEFLTSVCGDAFTPSAGPDGGEEGEEPAGISENEEADDDDYGGDDGGDDNEVVRGFGKNLFLENEQRLLYPNPTSIEELKEEVRRRRSPSRGSMEEGVKGLLKRYEFLGRIVGKCLYEGILVDVAFAPFFLLKWSQQASDPKAGSAVGVNDLRHLDEDLYRGLVNLKNYTGDVESDFGLDFTISSRLLRHDKTITVDLKPNGEKIPVTNANKLEYIHLVSKYRLSLQAYSQTSAFLRGLNSIINPNWLSMFNQSELQTLVGGDINTPIDVEDLRRNTVYGGIYQVGPDGVEHESVQLFWQVMRSLGDDERRKVLKFVTSVARAPLLGFGVLRPRFSIRDAGEDQGRLCSASMSSRPPFHSRVFHNSILTERARHLREPAEATTIQRPQDPPRETLVLCQLERRV
jgi:ubiquitin-protein ligase E3 C